MGTKTETWHFGKNNKGTKTIREKRNDGSEKTTVQYATKGFFGKEAWGILSTKEKSAPKRS